MQKTLEEVRGLEAHELHAEAVQLIRIHHLRSNAGEWSLIK